MKCPKCEGEFNSKNTRYGKVNINHRLVDIKGSLCIRTRVCNNCKYKLKTVEIPVKRHLADKKLLNNIINAIAEYNIDRESMDSE